jgi:hypothetical protein
LRRQTGNSREQRSNRAGKSASETVAREERRVCADHEPDDRSGDRATHGAACHSCLLIAETSCEMRNLFLDRGLLVATMAGQDSSFFKLV